MPVQLPSWTEFLSCPICYNTFSENGREPVSLSCAHTICCKCLSKLQQKRCPLDQFTIERDFEDLPVNYALLQLLGAIIPEVKDDDPLLLELGKDVEFYLVSKECIETLAVYLKPLVNCEY